LASSVLDASALLALIFGEPGAANVSQAVGEGASINTVNLTEVITRLVEGGAPDNEIRERMQTFELEVIDFDAGLAYAAGALRRATRSLGLSLGDRACLALAQRLNLPAVTADRSWLQLALDVPIRLVR
jgi:ribonuclease VapC